MVGLGGELWGGNLLAGADRRIPGRLKEVFHKKMLPLCWGAGGVLCTFPLDCRVTQRLFPGKRNTLGHTCTHLWSQRLPWWPSTEQISPSLAIGFFLEKLPPTSKIRVFQTLWTVDTQIFLLCFCRFHILSSWSSRPLTSRTSFYGPETPTVWKHG